jgi:beta-galactosidase/beta-glucuronidase
MQRVRLMTSVRTVMSVAVASMTALAIASLSLALCASTAAAQAAAPASAAIPRAEHPRPDFVRADWLTLNGPWQFEFDDANRGLAERWHAGGKAFSKTIQVPYAFQTKLSGIGDTAFHDVVWYQRAIDVPAAWSGRRVLVKFGAVDYEAMVWVNGQFAGGHRGGQTPFGLDITDLLTPAKNTIVVRAWDPSTDRALPRGKQYWEPQSRSIWYTRTSGIWQPVWLEAAAPVRVERLRITPDVDRSQVTVEAVLNQPAKLKMRVSVALALAQPQPQAQGPYTDEMIVSGDGTRVSATMALREQRVWSPENPNLYDLTIELLDEKGQATDRVQSYFGQRKIHTQGDRVYLNNAPYYQRLVLDQGYWPESLLTPPSDAAIEYDIKMTKAFGFNGARKHQKVEDPRWLYFADKLGLLVWGEMANAQVYTDEYVSRMVGEWQEVVARDYNHPSIVAWVPINESWGVPRILTNAEQQEHARSLYHLTRALDQTRPVIDNDGWEHTEATDLFTLHDYAKTGTEMASKYEGLAHDRTRIPRNGREALVNGAEYNGTPILMTEFGGVAFRAGASKSDKDWGYAGIEPTAEAMLGRVDGLVKALRGNAVFGGFCYTQLTDVEQEINGLMTYDRKPKADPAAIGKIFGQ